jgi:hypothetical protein
MSKQSDENYTPNTESQPIIRLVQEMFDGKISLDPCSNSRINPNIPAVNHFTKEDDCFGKLWYAQNGFLNPPWSNPFPYVEKLCQEYELGRLAEAIALLESKTQASKNIGGLIENHASAICQLGAGKMIPNRLGFIEAETGKHRTGFTLCSILVYFGHDWGKFRKVFSPYGHVMLCDRTIKNLLG